MITVKTISMNTSISKFFALIQPHVLKLHNFINDLFKYLAEHKRIHKFIWMAASYKLAENQFYCIVKISYINAYKIMNADKNQIYDIVYKSAFGREKIIRSIDINDILKFCDSFFFHTKYYHRFNQIKKAYSCNCFWSACLGVFSLIDTLSVTYFDKTINLSVPKNRNAFMKHLGLNDISFSELTIAHHIFLNICNECLSKESSPYQTINFSEPENDLLNRHRLMHGRTFRDYNNIDFLKSVLLLKGIILMCMFQNDPNNQISLSNSP